MIGCLSGQPIFFVISKRPTLLCGLARKGREFQGVIRELQRVSERIQGGFREDSERIQGASHFLSLFSPCSLPVLSLSFPCLLSVFSLSSLCSLSVLPETLLLYAKKRGPHPSVKPSISLPNGRTLLEVLECRPAGVGLSCCLDAVWEVHEEVETCPSLNLVN